MGFCAPECCMLLYTGQICADRRPSEYKVCIGWFSFPYNDNLILELGTVRSHSSLTMDKPNWIMYLTYIIQQCHLLYSPHSVYCYIVKMCDGIVVAFFSGILYFQRISACLCGDWWVFEQTLHANIFTICVCSVNIKYSESSFDFCSEALS